MNFQTAGLKLCSKISTVIDNTAKSVRIIFITILVLTLFGCGDNNSQVLIDQTGTSLEESNTTSVLRQETNQITGITEESLLANLTDYGYVTDQQTNSVVDVADDLTNTDITATINNSNIANTDTAYNEESITGKPIERNDDLSEEEFWDLIKETKDKVLKELGDNYKIVGAGVEGSEEGYFYEDYGITIIFDEADKVYSIYCSPKVSIGGTHAEMNFEQVQKILGKAEIEDAWVETPENKAFSLSYKINDCTVNFLSYYEDGKESMLTVYSPY